MEITKREIIASVSILAIMLIIGFIIGGKLNEYDQDQNAKYLKAQKIEDKDIFEYSMKTNTGNAFVYGQLKAVDPVSNKDIKGDYMLLVRIREEYTMHTRTVTTTDSKGRTHTRIETYWTWDEVDREVSHANTLNFLGKDFKYSQFNLPSTTYIDTVKESSNVRYEYRGIPSTKQATIFSHLQDNNIGNNVPTYFDSNIKETVENLTSSNHIPIFGVIWAVLTIGIIVLFYEADNDWLNLDKKRRR